MHRAQFQQVFPAGPESQPLYGVSKFLMLLTKHKILLPKWSRTVLPPTLHCDLLVCYTYQWKGVCPLFFPHFQPWNVCILRILGAWFSKELTQAQFYRILLL